MKELNQFERYLVHEFVEDYQDGLLSRRDMVARVVRITGGVATTATMLTTLGVAPLTASAQSATPPPAPTPTGPRSPDSVAADDSRVEAGDITFPGPDGSTLLAYQAMAAGGATPMADGAAGLPVVLICHENRGLTDHIRDVARRWAAAGYLACAVDLLSPEGGTAAVADPADIPAILTDGDVGRHVASFQAAAAYYADQPGADTNRLGMTDYCFGGGITWRCATQMPELKAAAPYYGPPPPLEEVPNITAAVLGVYSDDPNDFANEGLQELIAALEEADITSDIKIYPNTQHAFHNDISPRWNEEQAQAAWADTLAWFNQYVIEAS
ncbi:MAG: dienelactone hydrolase family protein [Chloroflexia bacterium]|nr:dienelactone hydrolase family protein [Chloroflexia bacterium]